MVEITFIRDLIIVLIVIFSIFGYVWSRKSPKIYLVFLLLFLTWSLFSVLWRESSLEQWLKGARFTIYPLIVFFLIHQLNFEKKYKKWIFLTSIAVGIIIALLAITELFGFGVPLTTRYSGEGALDTVHFVGSSGIIRLQSILAGPNALGLYVVSLLAVMLFWGRENLRRFYLPASIIITIIGLLTFSRSAMVGLIIIWLLYGWGFLVQKLTRVWYLIGAIALFVVLSVVIFSQATSPVFRQIVSHDTSNSYRVEQYQRIWDTKNEIGLFGRGLGTAGPSSQNRLDSGENHWTENVYLDIFEETGLVGIVLFLGFLFLFGKWVFGLQNSFQKRLGLALLIAFSVTGLFINYYTGQAGVYLFWVTLALISQNGKQKINDKKVNGKLMGNEK